MPRSVSVVLVLVGLWLSGASPAAAQSTPSQAPPGNSAVDQYRESLPPSSGERRSLSRRDREALRRQGREGQALADVLERNGGVPRAADRPSASSDEARPDEGRRDRGSSSDDRGASDEASTGSSDRAGGGDGGANAGSDDGEARSGSVAPAAAASTVGPVPVWAMLAAAAALVGVGLIVRTRLTP